MLKIKIRYILYAIIIAISAVFAVSIASIKQQIENITAVKSTEYNLKTVFQTNGIVWSFAFISPMELLVTRRDGQLFYIHLTQNIQKQLPLPSVAVTGQGGLLDVHFQSVNNQDYVYLTYSTKTEDNLTTALARGTWDGQTINDIEQLFVAKVMGNSGRHFGSRLLFRNQHIYMTIGDRGDRQYAQDLSFHNGKILRLNLDGQAAADNPFANVANALPEIWSYGHRNPQGIDYDKNTEEIYSVEFGPLGGDELNLIEIGKNYGWPLITYGREYFGLKIGDTHHPDMEQPIEYWTPSISPSGMAFYYGDKIPQWQNSLFLASLGKTHLRRLEIKDNTVIEQEIIFADLQERIRHVRSGSDGYLYFSTDSGKIVKVSSD